MTQQADIDRLIASHDAMSASFDRTLTALAGGSLTLSISPRRVGLSLAELVAAELEARAHATVTRLSERVPDAHVAPPLPVPE